MCELITNLLYFRISNISKFHFVSCVLYMKTNTVNLYACCITHETCCFPTTHTYWSCVLSALTTNIAMHSLSRPWRYKTARKPTKISSWKIQRSSERTSWLCEGSSIRGNQSYNCSIVQHPCLLRNMYRYSCDLQMSPCLLFCLVFFFEEFILTLETGISANFDVRRNVVPPWRVRQAHSGSNSSMTSQNVNAKQSSKATSSVRFRHILYIFRQEWEK